MVPVTCEASNSIVQGSVLVRVTDNPPEPLKNTLSVADAVPSFTNCTPGDNSASKV